MPQPTDEEIKARVAKLPRNIREYIQDLERKTATAEMRADELLGQTKAENANSKIFIEAMAIDQSPTPINQYAQVMFRVGEERRDRITARVMTDAGLDWVELATGDGGMLSRSVASNVVRVRPDPYWMARTWPAS